MNVQQAVVELVDDSVVEELYAEYVVASSKTQKLEKKLRRHERLVDHFGYDAKKVETLRNKLSAVREYKLECLSKLYELKPEMKLA